MKPAIVYNSFKKGMGKPKANAKTAIIKMVGNAAGPPIPPIHYPMKPLKTAPLVGAVMQTSMTQK